jgi:hypothetical protein
MSDEIPIRRTSDHSLRNNEMLVNYNAARQALAAACIT